MHICSVLGWVETMAPAGVPHRIKDHVLGPHGRELEVGDVTAVPYPALHCKVLEPRDPPSLLLIFSLVATSPPRH
jgi:hypothetical protein